MSETKHTPEPFTLQDLFNNAWRHAVIEKQPPSVDRNGVCLYRGPNGTRCLIGVSIPDEKYDSACEALHASQALLMLNIPIYASKENYSEMLQLRELQACHDMAASPPRPGDYFHNVEERLRQFASQYHLSIPEGRV